MAKDKKKKKGKARTEEKASPSAGATLKNLAQNPLVADIVSAALVATAAALKDSKRARALASDAGEELSRLSQSSAKNGEAMWEMAMQIGRRSLEALTRKDEAPTPSKAAAKPKEPKAKAKAAKPAAKKKSKAAAPKR